MKPGRSVYFDRSYVGVPEPLPTLTTLPSRTVTTTFGCDAPRPSMRRPTRMVTACGVCAATRTPAHERKVSGMRRARIMRAIISGRSSLRAQSDEGVRGCRPPRRPGGRREADGKEDRARRAQRGGMRHGDAVEHAQVLVRNQV